MDNGEFNLGATVEFVFAPAEQDVYSYECPLKDLVPSGAKLGNVTFAGAGKAIALLWSSGVIAINISPLWGKATKHASGANVWCLSSLRDEKHHTFIPLPQTPICCTSKLNSRFLICHRQEHEPARRTLRE
jgi:hypothetical protein